MDNLLNLGNKNNKIRLCIFIFIILILLIVLKKTDTEFSNNNSINKKYKTEGFKSKSKVNTRIKNINEYIKILNIKNLKNKNFYTKKDLINIALKLKIPLKKYNKKLQKNILKSSYTLYIEIKNNLLEKAHDLSNKSKDIENLKKELMTDTNKFNDKNIEKYNKALVDYINFQKSKSRNVNIFEMGKNLENSIYNIFYDTENFNKTEDFDNVRQSDLFNGKFKNDIVEGFANNNSNDNSNDKDLIESEESDESKELQENNDEIIEEEENEIELNDSDDKSLTGYLKYIFVNIFNIFNKIIKNYVNNDIFKNNDSSLIGSGILFIIISLGLYFIDISS